MPKPKPTWKDMRETKALVRWLKRERGIYRNQHRAAAPGFPLRQFWIGKDDAFDCSLSKIDRLSTPRTSPATRRQK